MKKIETACIIDDDPIYVFYIREIFAKADFCNNYLVYHNGLDALNKLKVIVSEGKNIPEVIFLDLNMPVMDGWEFLDEFVKVPVTKKINIYIVTSSIDPADTLRAKQYDAVENYMVKPITREMLKQIAADFNY